MGTDIRIAGLSIEMTRRVDLAVATLAAYRVSAKALPWQGSGCELVVVDINDAYGMHVAEVAARRQVKTLALGCDKPPFIGRIVCLPGSPPTALIANAIVRLIGLKSDPAPPAAPTPAARPARGPAAETSAQTPPTPIGAPRQAPAAATPAAVEAARTTAPRRVPVGKFAWSELSGELANCDVRATLGSREVYLRRKAARVCASSLSDLLFAHDHLTDEHWTLHKLKSLPEGAGELSRSLDVFLLQAALQQHEKVPSVGEQRFTLDHWPDLAGASESIDSLRVAGALSRQAHSVRSAAELLALDESVVNAHFWAFKSGGLLNVAGVTQPVARAKPSSSRVQPGFFARLAAHFGLSR